ncbi:MAG: hypothetical protein QXV46_01925 [Candidatus Bathyarchaeia archaeon]|nr:hypothetical protein [Candidatus Bathyarchaeota archaeon]
MRSGFRHAGLTGGDVAYNTNTAASSRGHAPLCWALSEAGIYWRPS